MCAVRWLVTKQRQCKNIEISRFFFVVFAEKELFSGKDSTFACGNKLFSETQITLWVVPSFNNVLRTHTYTFKYRFGTNMAPD